MERVASTFPRIDADGHLHRPGDWNIAVADELARRSGAHGAVIDALRDDCFRFGSVPTMDGICRFFGSERERVRALSGACLGAWVIAGPPNPGDEKRARLRLI